MKKILIATVLVLGLSGLRAQAQSTASGVSNTGTPTAGAKQPAQNGSTGAAVEPAGTAQSGGANQQKNTMNQSSTSTKSKANRMRKTKTTSGQ